MDLYNNRKLKPMLLSETEEPFDDDDYIFEIKFDGTRTLIFVDSKNIYITNRRGNDLTRTYPELHKIKTIVKKKVIFDGEIILMQDGKPSFKKLQERALLKNDFKINYFKDNFPVTFVCYDILYEDKDLTELSLMERKEILSKYKDTDFFVKTIFIENEGIELYSAIEKEGLEGIVAKEKNSLYVPGKRTSKWLKIKNWMEENFWICGYQINEASPMNSLILGRKENNRIYYVGSVTIGKNNSDFKTILKSKVIKKSPFVDFDEENTIYFKPTYQAAVSFLEKTKTNKLRQPIYKDLL